MEKEFKFGGAEVMKKGTGLEKSEKKDPADVLQKYLHHAATIYEQLSFWKSKGDKKLRGLVQDAEEDNARVYPYDHGTNEEIIEKTATLKLSVDEAVNLLGNLVKKLLKSDGISQVLEDKLGKKIGSLEEARTTAQELIRPFHDQYSCHLKANGGKGKRTRDVMSSDEAAWDIASKAIPSDLDIMDNESFQAFQEQGTKFQDMLEKLVLLPGPHQKYAMLLADGQGSAQDVNLLLNSYTFTGGKSTNRFKKLAVEYDKQDLKNLDVLIAEASRLVEEAQQKLGIEIPSTPEGINIETAVEILGREKVFGQTEVQQVWGVELAEVPAIPFSKEDLEKAKSLGMYLILRIDKDGRGRELTVERMNELKQVEFTNQEKGKILYGTNNWYKNEDFFTAETPKLSWALTSGDILADSTGKDYITQTEALRDHLKQQGWLNEEEEQECNQERLQQIRGVMQSNWQEASRLLQELKVNQNHRLSFAETLYDFISLLVGKNKRILVNKYNWTKNRSSSGLLVAVGSCVDDGANVVRWRPDSHDGALGVSFSR